MADIIRNKTKVLNPKTDASSVQVNDTTLDQVLSELVKDANHVVLTFEDNDITKPKYYHNSTEITFAEFEPYLNDDDHLTFVTCSYLNYHLNYVGGDKFTSINDGGIRVVKHEGNGTWSFQFKKITFQS